MKARLTVEKLSSYVCARDLYKKAEVFLDANENSLGSTVEFQGVELNRYPDPEAIELKKELVKYCNVNMEEILLGNGSDEIISLVINTFAEKGDNIISIEPGYSMYEISAQVAGVEPRIATLLSDYSFNVDKVLEKTDDNTKLIMFPYPNSVIGNVVTREQIAELLEKFKGIVFVDEAYFEFYGKTAVPLLKKYDNLIVSRTFSKAWGLAAVRIGYCVSNKEVISAIRKIKLPYNVGAVSQALAVQAIKNQEKMLQYVAEIKKQREWLSAQLALLELRVFPSVVNFVTIKLPPKYNSRQVQARLAKSGIIVRDRSSLPMMQNCIRITIGKPNENALLVQELKKILES